MSEKQFSVFASRGGQNSPLMHVPLLLCCNGRRQDVTCSRRNCFVKRVEIILFMA